ncbi:hypothetical protein H072_3486 [Dactylellina haptotyla CBS 200.50]|uniref:Uncharacterized protein n=1 Tax=Dactylellina haptotyla (strain CBS 200.50) TaxID=1284197 RepID=S8AHL3_DACHA|nr:hypothetical protein H072_3486 [Dactylellina haptotyla CBS 200.50]
MKQLSDSEQGRGETSKRLLAQLANESLITFTPITVGLHTRWRGENCIIGNTGRWIELSTIHGITPATLLETPIWRPDDLVLPALLCSESKRVEDDDPGTIFEFLGPWNAKVRESEREMAMELRNAAAMGGARIALSASQPLVNLQSSFLDWENAFVTGHPVNPFHRNCVPDKLLAPIGPKDLPRILNPSISIISLPRSDVSIYGEFEALIRPLLKSFGVECSTSDERIIIPYHAEQVPAILTEFPDARVIKTMAGRARAQSSTRTVSIEGYPLDLKFSLAVRIGTVFRQFGNSDALFGVRMSKWLRNIVPDNLWVFEEVASISGNEEKKGFYPARRLACVLRESLISRADERNETLILPAALIDRPYGESRTYAEIVFGLHTKEQKLAWFRTYLEALLPLALHTLRHHGVALETHAQNMVLRVCRSTKRITGFAIRDMGGIRIHRSTLEKEGFPMDGIDEFCSDSLEWIWDRTHYNLIQNNIGYTIYSLGIEKPRDGNAWEIVRSVLKETLDIDKDPLGRRMYEHLTSNTMALKCFMGRRMAVQFNGVTKYMSMRVPNLLNHKSPWVQQLSLAATKSLGKTIRPEQTIPEIRALEKRMFQKGVIGQSRAQLDRFNPHPILFPVQFFKELEIFNDAFTIALDNIVERWWTDLSANFPCRMPIDHRAADLLKWIDQLTTDGIMRPFRGNEGSWRPDFLILPATTATTPDFRVCEINARFSHNWISKVATIHQALAPLDWQPPSLEAGASTRVMRSTMRDLFNPHMPIHFLGEKMNYTPETGYYRLVEEETGVAPRVINPSQLRLVASKGSRLGFKLCCTVSEDQAMQTKCANPSDTILKHNGELLEEIHQIGLKLFEPELYSLSTDIFRHIALRCVNDPRSIFLIHDKRILGIVQQELDDLVHKHGVLTSDQADCLRRHIIPTILPGSPEFTDIVARTEKDETTKDNYILKPIRDCAGVGILLGRDISIEKWKAILKSMDAFDGSGDSYMLQPFLEVGAVDLFWDEERGVKKTRLVGTYFSANGKFAGFGDMRGCPEAEKIVNFAGDENMSFPTASLA